MPPQPCALPRRSREILSKREQTTESELLVFISPAVIVEEQMAREIDEREETMDDMRQDIKKGLFR